MKLAPMLLANAPLRGGSGCGFTEVAGAARQPRRALLGGDSDQRQHSSLKQIDSQSVAA